MKNKTKKKAKIRPYVVQYIISQMFEDIQRQLEEREQQKSK